MKEEEIFARQQQEHREGQQRQIYEHRLDDVMQAESQDPAQIASAVFTFPTRYFPDDKPIMTGTGGLDALTALLRRIGLEIGATMPFPEFKITGIAIGLEWSEVVVEWEIRGDG